MRKLALVAAIATASVGIGGVAVAKESRQPRRDPPRSTYVPRGANVGSIAQGNRHTGKPHEHKREIARRLRRKAA